MSARWLVSKKPSLPVPQLSRYNGDCPYLLTFMFLSAGVAHRQLASSKGSRWAQSHRLSCCCHLEFFGIGSYWCCNLNGFNAVVQNLSVRRFPVLVCPTCVFVRRPVNGFFSTQLSLLKTAKHKQTKSIHVLSLCCDPPVAWQQSSSGPEDVFHQLNCTVGARLAAG